MKKNIYLILAISLLCACQKEDDNGDFGGFWKVMQVEHHSGEVIDLKEESYFWRVQLDLLQFGDSYRGVVFGRFQFAGDSLNVQLLEHRNKDHRKYGIYNNDDERYYVEKLNRNSMILQSDSARVVFRKF